MQDTVMQRDTGPTQPPHRGIRVSALVQDDDDRVLTVRLSEEETYRLPGGFVSPKEGLVAALRYTVREQTGLTVDPAGLVVVEDRHVDVGGVITEFVYAVPRLPRDVEIRLPPPSGRSPQVAAFQWLTLDEHFRESLFDCCRPGVTLQVRPRCVDDECTKLQALQIRAAIEAGAARRVAELEDGQPAYRGAWQAFDGQSGALPVHTVACPEQPVPARSHEPGRA
ncbi:NUDIX domain-containing protein [Streptomyces syringium]|uniref:NUDIX domain-containing protein n=1 Tax=Streptomyces syringium TaxID=76729 RepID=UPI0037D354F7